MTQPNVPWTVTPRRPRRPRQDPTQRGVAQPPAAQPKPKAAVPKGPRALRHRLEDPEAAVKTLYQALAGRPGVQVVIGIDPGMSGALAFMPTDRALDMVIVDMPVMHITTVSKRKGERVDTNKGYYDFAALARLLGPCVDRYDRTIVALERGQARLLDTPVTAFAVGVGYGMWHLFFAAVGIPLEEARPSVWKKSFGLAGKEKDASRLVASRLFPRVAKFFSCKSDDGRAEAALVAEYISRRLRGQGAQ